MAEDLKPLILKISADIKGLTTGLDKAEKKTKGFGDTVKKFAGVAAVGALVAVGKAAVDMSIEFNRAMGKVETLIPGNTARVRELAKSVEDLSLTTGKAATDIAGGLFEVISAFGDSAESADIMRVAVRAATAGFSTTESSVNLLSGVMKGYNDVSAASAQKTADLAFLTNKLGQTTFPELAASMGNVVPIASTLGVKQEELFGIMATLTGVTGNTAEVSTQLKAAMSNLLKPNKDLKKIYKELNVEGGEQLIQQEGLVGAMRILQEATGGSTAKFGKLFKSTEALNAVFALTGSQADVFDDKFTQMQDSAGSAEEAFTALSEGINATGFEMEKAKRQVEKMQRALGEELLPALGIVAEGANTLLTGFGPKVAAFLVSLADAILFIVQGLVDAVSAMVNVAVDAVKSLTGLTSQTASILGKGKSNVDLSKGLKEFRQNLEDVRDELIREAFASEQASSGISALIKKHEEGKRVVKGFGDVVGDTTEKTEDYESSLNDLKKQQKEFVDRLNRDIQELGGFHEAVLANADAAVAWIKETERLDQTLTDAQVIIKAILVSFGLFPGVTEDVVDGVEDVGESFKGLKKTKEDIEKDGILPKPDPKDLEQFESEFEKAAEAASAAFVNAFENTLQGTGDFMKALGIGMGAAIAAGIEEGFADELASLTNVLKRNLGDAFGGALGGAIGAAIPVLGQLVGNQIGSFIANAFSGPSNQELFAQAGTKAGQIFGANWSTAAQSAMERVGNSIQKAASGKVDIVAAMWHPETLIEVLKKIETAGVDVQKTWAQNLEDNVKPVLMTTLGMTEAEAAQAMAPLFNEILSKIAPGAPIDAEFQRMLDWAVSMGVQLSDSFDMATVAARDLNAEIAAGNKSVLDTLEAQQAAQDARQSTRQKGRTLLGVEGFKDLKAARDEILEDDLISPEEIARIKQMGSEEKGILLELLNQKIARDELKDAQDGAIAAQQALLDLQLASIVAIGDLINGYEQLAGITLPGGGVGSGLITPQLPGGGVGGNVNNNNITINSDNPEGFRHWMRNGNGANEVADFVNRSDRTQVGNRNRGR